MTRAPSPDARPPDPSPAEAAALLHRLRRGPWPLLGWLVLTQRRRVVAGAVLGSCWMLGLVVPPYVLSVVIDSGLRPRDPAALFGWVAVLLAVGVATAALSILRHRTMTRVRMDAAYRTVSTVSDHAITLGAALARRAAAGEVAAIGMTDVWTIARCLTATGPGVGAVVAYAVVAVLLARIAPPLAVVVCLGVPVLAVLVGPTLGRLQRVVRPYRAAQGELTGRLLDLIAGLGVLNGLGGKDRFHVRYGHESQQLRQQGYRVAATTSVVQALGAGLPSLFLAVVVWLAARMASQGTLSVGQLVAVYGYAAVLVVPVSALLEAALDLPPALVAARRVVEFLRLTPEREEPAQPAEPPPASAPLLDPGSGLVVPPGRLTAVATASLADASALADRLAGLSPSDVRWDGVPLALLRSTDLRGRIRVAQVDAELFAGTLAEVVAGAAGQVAGPDAVSESRLRDALHTAAADDLVGSEGLAGRVDRAGSNLSGGQRQRLRLARVLIGEPEVLVAVDPTSAVDAQTEALIADRLHRARSGLTTVVTSTSPLLLDRADQVHLLVDGRVTASGSHRELLAGHPSYRALVLRGVPPADEAGG